MVNNVFESTVEFNEDYNEYYLTIPEEILERFGWEEGDVLEWIANKDGTVLLQRSEEFFGDDE